jgi:ParB-like nuclease domain.
VAKQFALIDEILVENRQRQEFSEEANQGLQQSIREIGLLHAVVLEDTPNGFILRAGERRLRAVSDLAAFGIAIKYNGGNVDLGYIPYTSWESLTDYQRLQIEVDENNQRLQFTWQESAMAMAKLAELRRLQAEAGEIEPPTTMTLAAEAYVQNAKKNMHPTAALARAKDELILARYLHVPEVAKAKTAKEALLILKARERVAQNKMLAEKAAGVPKSSKFQLYHADSEKWAAQQDAGQFDVILTDPPYGVGANTFGRANEGSTTAHGYDDSEDVLQNIIQWFPKESYRLTKEQAHLYLFCDIKYFSYGRLHWKLLDGLFSTILLSGLSLLDFAHLGLIVDHSANTRQLSTRRRVTRKST